MHAIRLRFKKEGRAKFISHLDLNRVMQRALRRANIPIWRTQGFNPHPYIVFALPLSLFYESDCEFMDAKLDEEMPLSEIKERLAAQMPEGIVILQVAEPKLKFTEIGFASYLVELDFNGVGQSELEKIYSELLNQEDIMVEKSTKRNTFDINIKEYFTSAKTEISDGQVKITAALPAGTQNNLNASCIAAAFEKYARKPDFESIRRLQVYTNDMNLFE